jgi:ATP-dependent helicase/nuclease subunit A
VVDALAHEQAERSREELNALYVALTRTQRTLVISSMAPHREHAGSWWRRLEGRAQDAPEVSAALPTGVVGDTAADAALVPYALKIVQKIALAHADTVQVAPEKIAKLPLERSAEPTESLESRLGQALHRLLEWVQPAPGGYANRPYTWPPVALARVAKEFALDAAQAQAAAAKAQAVLQGEGAWIWNSAELAWHANEVPITQRGRLLRMDRLVQQRQGAWWVLDYKSSAQPQQDAALCAQLLGYREAVALANPGQAVRAAFLTPQGQLIELTPA